jgi:hypothetical protein
VRFIAFSLASCDETTDHLETLWETGSLTDEPLYTSIHQKLDLLGRKLNLFHQAVQTQHQSVREDATPYDVLGETVHESE